MICFRGLEASHSEPHLQLLYIPATLWCPSGAPTICMEVSWLVFYEKEHGAHSEIVECALRFAEVCPVQGLPFVNPPRNPAKSKSRAN